MPAPPAAPRSGLRAVCRAHAGAEVLRARRVIGACVSWMRTPSAQGHALQSPGEAGGIDHGALVTLPRPGEERGRVAACRGPRPGRGTRCRGPGRDARGARASRSQSTWWGSVATPTSPVGTQSQSMPWRRIVSAIRRKLSRPKRFDPVDLVGEPRSGRSRDRGSAWRRRTLRCARWRRRRSCPVRPARRRARGPPPSPGSPPTGPVNPPPTITRSAVRGARRAVRRDGRIRSVEPERRVGVGDASRRSVARSSDRRGSADMAGPSRPCVRRHGDLEHLAQRLVDGPGGACPAFEDADIAGGDLQRGTVRRPRSSRCPRSPRRARPPRCRSPCPRVMRQMPRICRPSGDSHSTASVTSGEPASTLTGSSPLGCSSTSSAGTAKVGGGSSSREAGRERRWRARHRGRLLRHP